MISTKFSVNLLPEPDDFTRALVILTKEGYVVGPLSGSSTTLYATLDGQRLNVTEVLEMTKTPDSAWPFELHGTHCEVRVYFDHEGMAYEVRCDRKRVGERRRASETEYGDAAFATRLIAEMTGSGDLL
jgi:hypothetical protein